MSKYLRLRTVQPCVLTDFNIVCTPGRCKAFLPQALLSSGENCREMRCASVQQRSHHRFGFAWRSG